MHHGIIPPLGRKGAWTFLLWAGLGITAWAAPAPPETSPYALLWSYMAGGVAFLVPLALILWVVSGLEEAEGKAATLLVPTVMAMATLAYIATGFALEFGGVGLMDPRHGFSRLVWEWSALPEQWGPYWGMAGFAGWFLAKGAGSPEAVALFIGHLPWIVAATFIPALVLRRRVPAAIPLIVALFTAGFLIPVAGNWTHGGGWLARLGSTLGWGHGFVDVGGSALVGLGGGGVGLAMLLAFRLTRETAPDVPPTPPRVTEPLLAAVGVIFLVVGTVGWTMNNPLYRPETLPLHRILANAMLGLAGGAALPALYIWFVAGEHHPHFPLAGGFAGWLSVLAGLPFLPPWMALAVGMFTGFLVPLVMYLVREKGRLDDPAGLVTSALLGGLVGTLVVGWGADGRYGAGWNGIGAEAYLGVPGQGVSGAWVAAGYAPDWPGQMYAQLAGAAAHFFWAFLLGSLLGVGLALLAWALRRLGRGGASPTPPEPTSLPEEIPAPEGDTPPENAPHPDPDR